MKRILVMLSVLAAFFLATVGAYAVETSTWGQIKATFSETPSQGLGDLQLLRYTPFPRALAKRIGEEVTAEFAAGETGKVELNVGWAQIEVKITGKIEESLTLTLSVQESKHGIPLFAVEGSPPQECSATLRIQAQFECSSLDPISIALVHETADGLFEIVDDAKIKVDIEDGVVKVDVHAKLDGFSRYALAGSLR